MEVLGDTPALRLFALLELIVGKSEYVSLHGLVEESGLPKPTVHRMLQQLEAGGILVRQSDGRHYGTGVRVRRFAESVLLNATQHGARRTVLRELARTSGETVSATTLVGGEVVLLDRAEADQPLRFQLSSGIRIPFHASASGKILVSQFDAAQRRKLLPIEPLAALTERTLTTIEGIEQEVERCRELGYGRTREEYLTGLVTFAVLVPSDVRSNMAIEVEIPTGRFAEGEDPARFVEPLRAAALALSQVDEDGSGAAT